MNLPPIIANIPADELPQHHGVRWRRHINNERDTKMPSIHNAVETIRHVRITSGFNGNSKKKFQETYTAEKLKVLSKISLVNINKKTDISRFVHIYH